MNSFSNNYGDYASTQEIKMLQDQIDLLKQLVDYNHNAIEAFLHMFEECETKFTAIQNFADAMSGVLTTTKDTIFDLESRVQKLEQKSNNGLNSFFSTLP